MDNVKEHTNLSFVSFLTTSITIVGSK